MPTSDFSKSVFQSYIVLALNIALKKESKKHYLILLAVG